MLSIDIDRFRALKPWRDPSFYITLATTLALVTGLIMPDVAAWVSDNRGAMLTAISPILTWLTMNGLVRVGGALALGNAVAGSRYVDVSADYEQAKIIGDDTL